MQIIVDTSDSCVSLVIYEELGPCQPSWLQVLDGVHFVPCHLVSGDGADALCPVAWLWQLHVWAPLCCDYVGRARRLLIRLWEGACLWIIALWKREKKERRRRRRREADEEHRKKEKKRRRRSERDRERERSPLGCDYEMVCHRLRLQGCRQRWARASHRHTG